MKASYKTQHHALLQPHCPCRIQKIFQAQFGFPPTEGKGQLLLLLGVSNAHIEKVVCWCQQIILRDFVCKGNLLWNLGITPIFTTFACGAQPS